MDAGQLDQRIAIRRLTQSERPDGGFDPSWATLAERWAKVAPLSGRERDMAQQTEAPRDYRVTLRRDSVTASITEADVLRWRGVDMNIRFIADAGPRPVWLVFEVEAGVAPETA